MTLLKKLVAATRPRVRQPAAAPLEFALETEEKLNRLHSRAPIRKHLDILYGDTRIGSEGYPDLYWRCLHETGTAVTPFNVFQRFQTRHDLVRYFLATLPVAGARAECGAYRGATALLLCHTWRSVDVGFRGDGFHLIDSFSGTSPSTTHDLIAVRDSAGETRMQPFFPAGKTDADRDAVRGYFHQFPDVAIHAGWIPQVLDTLPETAWAFVHLDLTLYEPTMAALRYFYSRLASGGALICDGSILCPGAAKAVDDFTGEADVPHVMLGHREAVFLKP